MPQGSPSLGFLTFLVVVVVIVAGVGAGLLYEYNHAKPPASRLTVAIGDNVTVNYVGLFGSGPEQGRVFDTSLKSVATDNASYPKGLEYSPRPTGGYTPLPVHVGPYTPSGGYNVSGTVYEGVVPGFWKGLLGLAVNQSRYVAVPPSEGYGPLDPSCLVTQSLTQTIPTVSTMTASAFAKMYSGLLAVTGLTFADPIYGWTDTILSANTSAVVLEQLPYLGETVTPYGWTMLVTNLTAQTITLKSELTTSSVGNILGAVPGLKVCSASRFVIWSVDPGENTFVENYNSEVVGQTLIFEVTVVSILPP